MQPHKTSFRKTSVSYNKIYHNPVWRIVGMYFQNSIFDNRILCDSYCLPLISWGFIIASCSISMFDVVSMLLEIKPLTWDLVLDLDLQWDTHLFTGI